jgi:nicotinate-nucleotide adenylyltransferase
MKRTGIFGGTFNPVHKGHEMAADGFYKKCGLDKLIIMPANIPPHKQVDARIPALRRLEMCRICFGGYDNIYVSDFEIKKEGLSYTFDTLTALKEEYGDGELYFLVGSDMFLSLEKWHRYSDLLSLCTFVVAFRNGRDKRRVLEYRDRLAETGAEIELLENEPFEISSTELREKIKNNKFSLNLEKYISAGVLAYIREKGIYV